MAGLTLYQNIGKEVHFNHFHTSALTGFTTASLDIEAKAPWFVAPDHCLWRMGKEVSYFAKDTCISGRIRARNTPNR